MRRLKASDPPYTPTIHNHRVKMRTRVREHGGWIARGCRKGSKKARNPRIAQINRQSGENTGENRWPPLESPWNYGIFLVFSSMRLAEAGARKAPSGGRLAAGRPAGDQDLGTTRRTERPMAKKAAPKAAAAKASASSAPKAATGGEKSGRPKPATKGEVFVIRDLGSGLEFLFGPFWE